MEESPIKVNQIESKDAPLFDYLVESKKFLGEYYDFFRENEDLEQIYLDSLLKFEKQKINSKINYDQYKKEFRDENKKKFTRGEIIASRHLGFNFERQDFDTNDQLIKRQTLGDYNKLSARDIYLRELNIKLAEFLSVSYKSKDLSKSNDYKLTAERLSKLEKQEEKQLGFFAEQLMIATFERLSIDRKDDLGLEVYPANAYQDINDKIDFIISSKNKSKGVGTEIGIQFTINERAKEHKEEQISKAKNRNIEVSDILLVSLNMEDLLRAKELWAKNGKDIAGPWKYLPKNVKEEILRKILRSLVDEHLIESLVKKEM